MSITDIKSLLPDYAKDLRLNLDSVLSESGAPGLNAKQIAIIAIACADASRFAPLQRAINTQFAPLLSESELGAAHAAAVPSSMTDASTLAPASASTAFLRSSLRAAIAHPTATPQR